MSLSSVASVADALTWEGLSNDEQQAVLRYILTELDSAALVEYASMTGTIQSELRHQFQKLLSHSAK